MQKHILKNFLQFLATPAALGLLAPLAANAAEVNIDSVVDYAAPSAQVATSAQFSDVVPGDWAYTALQNLSESYGCVDNAYTQNLKNGQSLTRYEAAALINACLDNGLSASSEGFTQETTRLTNEFASEMAILKGRVDGLETRVNEFQAGQFSPTTKFMGHAVFTTGAVDGGDGNEALAMQYNFMLMSHTSFTGEDHLFISADQGNNADPLKMDSAMDMVMSNLSVSSLYYQFPLGDFQVTAGPLVDQDDVVSATTSTYSDAFRLSGMRFGLSGAMNETGPGVAVEYSNNGGFNSSISVVSDDGESASKGMFTEEGDDIITASIGYDFENFGGGLIYKSADENGDSNGETTLGGGIYFRPEGFPTISMVYDTKDPEGSGADSSSFMVGLDYPLGPGTASAGYEIYDNAGTETSNYEVYYNYPIADGIEIQGGVFIEEGSGSTSDSTGYVVETFFHF